MPDLILIEHSLSLVFFLALIGTCVYLFQERQRYRELKKESSLTEAKKKSNEIIHDALKESREIVSHAQAESIRIIDESKMDAKNFQERLGEQFDTQIAKAQTELALYLKDLRTQAEEVQLLDSAFTKQKAEGMIAKLDTRIENFLAQIEQKSAGTLEAELQAAKDVIENYKKQQLALVEENIIELLEKTLGLVLAKKLSLKDQLDLVYEALEEAKAEKLVI